MGIRPVQALQEYGRGAPASQLERRRPAAPGPFSTLQLTPSPLTWQVIVAIEVLLPAVAGYAARAWGGVERCVEKACCCLSEGVRWFPCR